MPERSEQQVISSRGEAHVEGRLSEWIVNEQTNDYGIDYTVTITDDQDEDDTQDVTSTQFFIQLKSSTFDGEDTVYADLSTDHISQYVSQPIPVLLVVYDDNLEEAYWLPVQEHVWDDLNDEKPNWQEQTQVRIRIHRSRTLDDLHRIKTAVTRTQNRITRHHSWTMNIGEGLAFTPDDFTEIKRQIDHSRLQYKGNMLLAARQHLKRGDVEDARESVEEVIEAPESDQATVKALFFEIHLRNYAVGEEAVEILELAGKARELADGLGIDVDEHIAHAYQAVAGLFICLDKRKELLMTDAVQHVDEAPGLPLEEYSGMRWRGEQDLLAQELAAVRELNEALSALLDADEYYAYAFVLSPVIDYVASRLMHSVLSPEVDLDLAGDEHTDAHPLVDQATQLTDFISDLELKFNLKKSIGLWHYHARNPDTAREFLADAVDLAREFDDEFLANDTDELLKRVTEHPNPYKTPDTETDEPSDKDKEEMTQEILELQGFDVPDDIGETDSSSDDGDTTDTGDEYDPFDAAIRHGIKDADPTEYYRHCEHLHLAYEPSMLGKLTGAASIGKKTLWCKHGGGMSGTSLSRIFDAFKNEHCEGCEYHSPRGEEWECTREFAEEQVNDPEFQEFLESRNAALSGQQPNYAGKETTTTDDAVKDSEGEKQGEDDDSDSIHESED